MRNNGMRKDKIISFDVPENIKFEPLFSIIDHKNEEELWLDVLYELKQNKPLFFYCNDYLGSPKYENGILEKCYKKGMSPQEALDWWKNYMHIIEDIS